MQTSDIKALAREIAPTIKDFVGASVRPLLDRLDALERRVGDMPAPVDLSDDLAALKSAVAAIPVFEIPKLPELPDIGAMIAEAVDAIPRPKDIDPADVQRMVDEAVAKIPSAKDGKSVTVEELTPIITETVQKAVAVIPAPKDGSGIRDLLIDRDGALVATMDDGRTKNLGPVVGRNGVDADMAAIAKSISDAVAALPKPKDGRDGFGFDDLDLAETDAGVMLRFVRGDQTKDFRLPIVIDRGVFNAEKSYAKGDGVTWGGSFWIAQEETTDKPDSGKGWRLSVKKGRDGRDGTVKAEQRAKVKI